MAACNMFQRSLQGATGAVSMWAKRCCAAQQRSVSSFHKSHPTFAVSKDGDTIICWHPEPSFPYEHTKPLPRHTAEISEGDSVLKVQYLMEERLKRRPDGPTIPELCNIFYTTKHRWYPKPGKKYRKLNPPQDREGL